MHIFSSFYSAVHGIQCSHYIYFISPVLTGKCVVFCTFMKNNTMRTAIIIGAFSLLALPARAQLGLTSRARHTFPGIEIGVKAGVNIQRTSGSTVWASPFTTGPMGGAYASFTKRNFGWRAELLAKMGWVQYKSTGEDVKCVYMDIPILAEYRILDVVTIHAGPVYTYMASARGMTGGSKLNMLFNKHDISLAVGADVRVNKRFAVQARYLNGFMNLNKLDNTIYTGTWKNSCLQLTLGYRFFE